MGPWVTQRLSAPCPASYVTGRRCSCQVQSAGEVPGAEWPQHVLPGPAPSTVLAFTHRQASSPRGAWVPRACAELSVGFDLTWPAKYQKASPFFQTRELVTHLRELDPGLQTGFCEKLGVILGTDEVAGDNSTAKPMYFSTAPGLSFSRS